MIQKAYKLLFFMAALGFSQTLQTTSFKEISGDIQNPERGWTSPTFIDDGEGSYKKAGISLYWLKLRADAYRAKPLDQAFFTKVETAFNFARKNGVKVIPRVLYNHDAGGDDAPFEIVMKHIEQLTPYFTKHADVIDVLDPGFVGEWGEWHDSKNGLAKDDAKRNALIKAILNMVPKDRMIYLRYPFHKLHYLGNSFTATSPWLDSSQAFNRTDIARIGHFNDCMFSGPDDVGTYQNGIDRSFGLKYIGTEAPFLPYGGETCSNAKVESGCSFVLNEMKILHINHLNSAFDGSVYSRWKSEGCYEEITRRFGYRFVLDSVTYQSQVAPGGKMEVKVKLSNVGFGELFNPRPVNVVLVAQDGKQTLANIPNIDPRWWKAGSSRRLTFSLEIPIGLSEGSYKIAIGMPDAYDSLKRDPRYSVRFANNDVWDASSGLNILATTLIVSKKSLGSVFSAQTVFKATATEGASQVSAILKSNSSPISLNYHERSNQIQIGNLPPRSQTIRVELVSILGESIIQKDYSGITSDISMDLPKLNMGLYLIKLQVGNKQEIRNFIVTK